MIPADSAAYQEKLLEFLHRHCEEVALWVRKGSVQATAAIKSPTNVMLGEASGDYDADGSSVTQALERLVCEVAIGMRG